jgi:hypothetical protein
MTKKKVASEDSVGDISFPEFSDLSSSTMTLVVRTNICFDFKKFYETIELVPTDRNIAFSTRRVSKSLVGNGCDRGLAFSVQYKYRIRGLPVRKSKKHWCGVCQRYEIDEQGNTNKIIDVKEIKLPSKRRDDEIVIKYECPGCEKIYSANRMGVFTRFRNQVAINITTGRNVANFMIFDGSIKIAGLRAVDDAMDLLKTLWEDYIQPTKAWKVDPSKRRLVSGGKASKKDGPFFIFQSTMVNFNFSFGPFINSDSFERIWKDEKKKNDAITSVERGSGQKNIKITFKDDGKVNSWKTLIYSPKHPGKDPAMKEFEEWPCDKALPQKVGNKKQTCIIVFMSSATILSSRNEHVAETYYEVFSRVVAKRGESIRETVTKVDKKTVMDLLKSKT